jgi:hypothetical protein
MLFISVITSLTLELNHFIEDSSFQPEPILATSIASQHSERKVCPTHIFYVDVVLRGKMVRRMHPTLVYFPLLNSQTPYFAKSFTLFIFPLNTPENCLSFFCLSIFFPCRCLWCNGSFFHPFISRYLIESPSIIV